PASASCLRRAFCIFAESASPCLLAGRPARRPCAPAARRSRLRASRSCSGAYEMRGRVAGALIAGLLLASRANAHSSFEGINDFYAGVLHPAVVPAHALAILSLGLFLGQRRLAAGLERVLLVYVAALAGGAVLAAFSRGA